MNTALTLALALLCLAMAFAAFALGFRAGRSVERGGGILPGAGEKAGGAMGGLAGGLGAARMLRKHKENEDERLRRIVAENIEAYGTAAPQKDVK